MTTILTDDQLKEEVGKLAGGQKGVMPEVTPVLPTVKDDELQTTQGATVTGDVTASTAPTITPITPITPFSKTSIFRINVVSWSAAC